MANGNQKDKWDITETIFKILSAIAIPVVLAIAGYYFNAALTEREVQGQIVQVAVETLRDPATKENTHLRAWAVSVINTYSGVPLSAELQQDLIQGLSLPKSPSIDETPTP